MLFITVERYDAEIEKATAELYESMKNQATVRGGVSHDMSHQRGSTQAIKDWLELLSKEREVLLNRQRGQVTHVEFGREC